MNTALIMSAPDGSLAETLLKSGISDLVCVTRENVHLRSSSSLLSGREITGLSQVKIDIPKIKTLLLEAYPLIDRWVSRKHSLSTTLELCLEYTILLIQIIENNRPSLAILETGAPHHMFSYCLDIALNYLDVPLYYLYGNSIDGRCCVVKGKEKTSFVSVTNYNAQSSIDAYISQVKGSSIYTPADSTASISHFLHRNFLYALYLHLRISVAKIRNRRRRKLSESPICLKLPFLSFWEVLCVIRAQISYQKIINRRSERFLVQNVNSDDIVYVGHMVPEATSFPECPKYPGEIDVLIDLKNRFPNTKIYYREHPAIKIFGEFGHLHLQGLHKNQSFYNQLARLEIDVVPVEIHISKIRERGCLFATKTGRVAVENSILNIPTIVYGFPFYGIDLPLTHHISRLACTASVREIQLYASKIKNPLDAVRSYLVLTFSGTIENPGISVYSDPKVRPVFEQSLVKLIQKLCN
ncbi:hypothetical protein [Lentilitoribacter sp. EG35]|uniref:hypothetical protein n=1 Tax=Lentilitoribacter sp. EG35 TaxID=3234192 RepID=UPI003460FC03